MTQSIMTKPLRGIISRYISSPSSSSASASAATTASTASLFQSIPPNLVLADEKVLKPTVTKSEIQQNFHPMIYFFPTLDVPTEIPVIPFRINDSNNGSNSDSSPKAVATPAERKIFEVAIRKDIIHDAVRYYRALRRQPHKTKRIGKYIHKYMN